MYYTMSSQYKVSPKHYCFSLEKKRPHEYSYTHTYTHTHRHIQAVVPPINWALCFGKCERKQSTWRQHMQENSTQKVYQRETQILGDGTGAGAMWRRGDPWSEVCRTDTWKDVVREREKKATEYCKANGLKNNATHKNPCYASQSYSA